MENMLKLLENMCAATKKEQLMPVLDISCTMMAKLILQIFELCAPAFKVPPFDVWFLPLKDATYTPPDFDENRYRFPDGIDANTLFMNQKVFSLFAGITGGASIDTEGKMICTECLLSQTGEFFKEKSLMMVSNQSVIVSAVTIDEIAEEIYDDDNPTNSWCIVFAGNIVLYILKHCAYSHPELCENIRTITDKVNFAACVPKQKTDFI